MAGECPLTCEGAVKAFNLAVGLRSVGAGAFVADAQVGAGLSPGVGSVAAVVGQDAFDDDPAVGEPADRPAQHGDGGGCGLVVVDFGLGHAGVVVDDGVHVGVTEQDVAVFAAGGAGNGPAVDVPRGAADESPAAADGDVAEFLDVDVDQRAGVVVFVATDLFPAANIEVRESIQSTSHQNGVHGGGG